MRTAGWRIIWKKIIAAIDATFAVAKRKPEKNSGLYGIRTIDLCDTGAALYQLKGIECLIINSYFFYADFFCLSIFFFVGLGYVTFIVVVCNFVIHYKTDYYYCKLVHILADWEIKASWRKDLTEDGVTGVWEFLDRVKGVLWSEENVAWCGI